MRYYITADPHGFFTQFQEALKNAGYFDDTTPHRLLILGDMLDRGHEATQMQAFLLTHLEQNDIILVRGNHEDLFTDLVTTDEGRPFSHHLTNGTFSTALQLTGYDRTMAMIRNLDFAAAARKTPFFTRIIPATVNYFETEHYIFVHGWIPCNKKFHNRYETLPDWRTADEDKWVEARWFNGMDAALTASVAGKTIVCGHFHTSYGHYRYEHRGSEFNDDADFSPYIAPGIIALDACTAFSGMVNCIVLED